MTRRWLAFTSAVSFVVAVAVLRLVERQVWGDPAPVPDEYVEDDDGNGMFV